MAATLQQAIENYPCKPKDNSRIYVQVSKVDNRLNFHVFDNTMFIQYGSSRKHLFIVSGKSINKRKN